MRVEQLRLRGLAGVGEAGDGLLSDGEAVEETGSGCGGGPWRRQAAPAAFAVGRVIGLTR